MICLLTRVRLHSVLALNHLAEHADCVLTVDNQALTQIVARIEASTSKAPVGDGGAGGAGAIERDSSPSSKVVKGSAISDSPDAAGKRRSKGDDAPPKNKFDSMNNICANLVCLRTSSS